MKLLNVIVYDNYLNKVVYRKIFNLGINKEKVKEIIEEELKRCLNENEEIIIKTYFIATE